MKTGGVDHVIIYVKDIEKAMKFFSDILGIKFVGPIDHRRGDVIPKRHIKCAFDDKGLELISPMTPDDPVAKYMEKMEGGQGLGCIGVRVPDLEEAIAELEAKGVKLERRVETPGVIKGAIFYPEGAFGVRIELVQFDSVSPICLANLGLSLDKLFCLRESSA